tara:strand:+ start:119 stop:433 length:315 start_codon:yes stop_codon:yes gene_type:complete
VHHYRHYQFLMLQVLMELLQLQQLDLHYLLHRLRPKHLSDFQLIYYHQDCLEMERLGVYYHLLVCLHRYKLVAIDYLKQFRHQNPLYFLLCLLVLHRHLLRLWK